MSDDDRDGVKAHARAQPAEIRRLEALEVETLEVDLLDPAVRSDPDRLDRLPQISWPST